MSVVIDLNAERDRREKDDRAVGPWVFSIDVYAPGEGLNQASGFVTGFNDLDGLEAADRLRNWATHLEQLALTLRQNAHDLIPDKKGRVLATCIVWEDSHVRSWISNDIETPEQVAWLKRQLTHVGDELKEGTA